MRSLTSSNSRVEKAAAELEEMISEKAAVNQTSTRQFTDNASIVREIAELESQPEPQTSGAGCACRLTSECNKASFRLFRPKKENDS